MVYDAMHMVTMSIIEVGGHEHPAGSIWLCHVCKHKRPRSRSRLITVQMYVSECESTMDFVGTCKDKVQRK